MAFNWSVRYKVAREVADFLYGAKDECKQQRNAIYALGRFRDYHFASYNATFTVNTNRMNGSQVEIL